MKALSFVIILLLLFGSAGYAQSDLWYTQPTEQGTVILGAGPTYIGGTAKAGIFLKHNRAVGLSAEFNNFLSTRKEAGFFARQYLNSNRFSVYMQPGISFGTFKSWNLNIDNFEEEQTYKSAKLNFSMGGEIRLSRMLSFEGEAGIGKLINVYNKGWVPSVRCSVNFRIKNKRK